MMRLVLVGAVVLGCGTSPRVRPDAEVPADGDPDGLETDANVRGLISVLVNSPVRREVLVNAPVLYHEPDGAVTQVATDAMGRASAMVADGTTVTVVFEEGRGVATIFGAKIGDQLVFGDGKVNNRGSLALTFAAYPGDVDRYDLHSPCGPATPSPGTTTLPPSICISDITSTDVMIVASKNFVPVAFAHATGVNLTTGALTMPNVWTPFPILSVTATNVPALRSISLGVQDSPENFGNSVETDVAPFSRTFPYPGTTGAYAITHSSRRFPEGNGRSTQIVREPLAVGATSYQLDVAGMEQPWLAVPTYTAATRRIAVGGVGGQTFDVAEYVIAFGGPNGIRWSLYAPDLNGVVLPTLPPALDIATGPVAGLFVNTYDAAALGGWDVVRPQVFSLVGVDPPLSVLGRVHMQSRSP
jgi:hypothetical protein